MTTVTITAKGQITIKKALLEAIGAKPGDKLNVDVRKGVGLVMTRQRPRTGNWDDVAGILKRPEGVSPLSIEDIKRVTEEGWAASGMRGLEES
jgi:antitoxin PrlF